MIKETKKHFKNKEEKGKKKEKQSLWKTVIYDLYENQKRLKQHK